MSAVLSRERAHRVGLSRNAVLLPGMTALFAYAAVAQGAFYRAQALFFAGGLVALLVVAGRRPGRDLAPPGVAFGALAVGMAVSEGAHCCRADALLPFATLVVGAASFAIAWAIVRAGERVQLLRALTLLGSGVAVLGLVGLAFHAFPMAMRAQGIWRTSSTLTYANSAGSLFALMLPAPLLALRAHSSRGDSVAVFLMMTGLMTSLSRGAAVGVVAMVVLLWPHHRAVLRAALRPSVAAVFASIAFLPSMASDHAQPLIAMVGLSLAGLAVVVPSRVRMARRTKVIAIVVAFGVLAVPAAASSPHAGRFWVKRIGPGSEDRLRTWRATWNAALDEPIVGTGPGTFKLIEILNGRVHFTRYAHNEFLHAFSETGAVGVVSIACAMGVFGAWAWRRRPRGDEHVFWAAGAAAGAAFVAHGTFDFMWHVPLLVGVVFMWLGVALARPDGGNGKDER